MEKEDEINFDEWEKGLEEPFIDPFDEWDFEACIENEAQYNEWLQEQIAMDKSLNKPD